MAEKGWTARIATAAGAAAGTGAAQLGLGYGLGVVVWPVTPASDDSAWLGSLGWATWITASATVFGAVLGSRYRGGPGPRTSGSWRFALAACAAVGSLVTVALIALPARSAVRFDTFTPQVIAGGYAAVGLLIGLVVAFWAVSSRPVAANLMATGVWLWALAVAGVVVELAFHRDSATYLTSWQFTEVANSGRYGTIYWPSALLTLGAAVLIGVLTAAPAARRGDLGTGAATSGVAGPLLVAIAFLALAPRLTGTLGPIESAYLVAPYAVLAGLAGSAATIAAGRALAARRPGAALTTVRLNTKTTSTPTARPLPDVPAAPPPAGAPQTPSGARSAALAEPPSPSKAQAARPSKATTSTEPARPAKAAPPTEPPRPAKTGAPTEPPRPSKAGNPDGPSRPSPSALSGPSPSTPPPAAVFSAEPQPAPESSPAKRKLFGRSKVPAQAPAAEAGKPPAPMPVVDAEIAAAARPRRPRPKKDTPTPAPPKSTVTPPPTAPTVAQINPKPSASE